MRSALTISLTFHLLITLIATQWVSFREVRFVPRQVYAVDLVTAAEVEKEKTEPPRVEPDNTPPEPEKKVDEMEPPPVIPKKKPDKKPEIKPKKTVPTTEIEKTLPKQQPPEPAESQPPTPETGEMAFDADDFPFAHYIGRMRRKIAAHWRVPEGSQGQDRYCTVYFRVMRDGSVIAADVEESSGLYIFDQAAQRAVVLAAPMPPLPQEYREEYLGVHFSFSYKER